jgi:hypothetical protein
MNLRTKVSFLIREEGVQVIKTGIVVGRTFEAEPRHDVMTADGQVIKNLSESDLMERKDGGV